jgi:hypothetical protein
MPLEKPSPLAVPPDATSSVPPLIVVASADPPELTISPPPLKMSVPLVTLSLDLLKAGCRKSCGRTKRLPCRR